MDRAHELWERVVLALAGRGVVGRDRCTPAELADRASRELGDARVRRFVWGYYYPCLFGDGSGTLSSEDAALLVRDLEARQARVEDFEDGSGPEHPDGPCWICGRRGS